MPRDLIQFTTKQVIVHKGGVLRPISESRIIEAVAGLKPGDMVDFIQTPDAKQVLIISDFQVTEPESLVKDAKFVPLNEVPVETASWSLPLCLPAILARSMDDRDKAWVVLEQLAGRYLELGAWSDQTKPWKDGLVAAVVRAFWSELKELGVVSGESHWGWIRGRYFIPNGGQSWEKVRGRFAAWMRAADVFLRNVEGREWIADLTLNQILEVSIYKANRCCGAIEKGLFSYSSELRKALFNPTISHASMNHLVAVAKGHRDEIPQRVIDEETGGVEYIIPETGEVVEEPDMNVLDQYLPEVDGEEIGVSSTPPDGVYWTYDYGRRAFRYFQGGEWTIGLSVQTDDVEVRKFVERIIAACQVAADYDS